MTNYFSGLYQLLQLSTTISAYSLIVTVCNYKLFIYTGFTTAVRSSELDLHCCLILVRSFTLAQFTLMCFFPSPSVIGSSTTK